MEPLPSHMHNLGRRAGRIGWIAAALALAVGFFYRDQFFESYLMAFVYTLSLAGGSLGFLMITQLVVGRWALIVQRPLEAGVKTFPLLLLLFLPLILGMEHLYAKWLHVDPAHATELFLEKQRLYLNKPFFLVRTAFYFAAWILMGGLLVRWSRRQDETGDPNLGIKMRRLSGIGLVLYGLTTTFAAFDWMMSLEPHWFSTIYGALYMVGQGVLVMALMAVVLHRLRDADPFRNILAPQQFHDVGNLLFAFTILWVYMGFGQFLIIWSANLYEETFWYLDRTGSWLHVSVVLFVVHFVLPFLLLLRKQNKRRSGVLVKIAMWMLVVRFIDFHWLIAPTFHDGFHLHVLDVLLPVALVGLWTSAFVKHLGAAPLVAARDERFVQLFGETKEGHAGT